MDILLEKCTGCGLCVKACPYGAIDIEDNKAKFNDNCIYCGLCISACPFDAIVKVEKSSKKDFSEYKGIYVYAEKNNQGVREVVFQLISKARELASSTNSFVATVVFNGTKEEVKGFSSAGSDKIININVDLPKDDLLAQAQALADIAKEYLPNIFLLGATPDGRSLGPRVAAKLKTGLTADCTKLEIENDLLVQTRPAYGGNLMAEIICPNHRPQMATVRPNTFKVKEFEVESKVIDKNYDKKFNTDIKVLDTLVQTNKSDLEHAEIIIGVGRGIGNKDNLDLVFTLAEKMNASIAASRPLVDAGWLDYDRQVGQTGKTVAPRVYIACGISGAIQHVAGISSADTIIAINSDPDAPIFKYADYTIKGNAVDIVSSLIEKLDQ